MNKVYYILLSVLLFVSCSPKKQYVVFSMSGSYVPVTKTDVPDTSLANFVDGYKSKLDARMNTVIAHSDQYMTTGRPESLLTNLTSDFMLQFEQNEKPIDIAFMNVHGIRAPIAEGSVTEGDIFNAYPFDNMLSIVLLKGEYVTQIFESYAKMGGAGISANIHLSIKDDQLLKATINGQSVDKNKLYRILTLDYLAEGNDGMDAMKNAELIIPTGIKLRDYMLDCVTKLESQGQKVSSKLDGRITIIE